MNLPWYNRLKEIVAPSEEVANLFLIAIILITLLVLLKGDAVVKAGWTIYMLSP